MREAEAKRCPGRAYGRGPGLRPRAGACGSLGPTPSVLAPRTFVRGRTGRLRRPARARRGEHSPGGRPNRRAPPEQWP